jgi:uncharacterized cofD-like protein
MSRRPASRNRKGKGRSVLDFLDRGGFFSLDGTKRRVLVEKVISLVLSGGPPDGDSLGLYEEIVREIEEFSLSGTKAVLFGGGTGLSSILGGDNTLPGWAEKPDLGLKMLFDDLVVVACATDDGGSSGDLVRRLPIIAVGDIRRAMISGITSSELRRVYGGLTADMARGLPGAIQTILNYRFGRGRRPVRRGRRSILSLLPKGKRDLFPGALVRYLEKAWERNRSHPVLSGIPLENHCLGNLLLVSEIYRGMPADADREQVPRHEAIVDGIHRFAGAVGAGKRTFYPASASQGELKFLYTNGVVVSGEHKSSVSRRGFPVDHVWAEYPDGACVDPRVVKAIREADIIITAPGSIYSSLLPILQVEEIADAVRKNRRAIKVLGANFWVQKGETDITIRDLGKEFLVSDLIEAFNKNIPGGTTGLFDKVVATNLRNLPAEVIQNYAIEGKVPIYLDKERVERLGFEPLAVEIHSNERLERGNVFQHDPARFSQVIRVLLFLRSLLGPTRPAAPGKRRTLPKKRLSQVPAARNCRLSEYMHDVTTVLDTISIPSVSVRRLLPEILWNNRDIRVGHLKYLRGIRVVPAERWKRSTAWDRILAYFDPKDYYINLSGDLLDMDEDRLTEDLLIGLGESLLGNYAGRKWVRPLNQAGLFLGKIFEIELRPGAELHAYLGLDRIREYLALSQLHPRNGRSRVFGRLINHNESFTPPGLLFGLLYAWYLNNRYGCIVDYDMSLLKIATSDLIPKPSMNKRRRQKLIRFFRRDVFGQ